MTDTVPLASTVLLLRDRPGELEVLMVQRNRNMKFMGGALVFPGGRVDDADEGAAPYATEQADDVALRIAGIREAFEECGILLARDRGTHTSNSDARRHAIAEKHRENVDKGGMTMAELAEAEGLEFATEGLVPFAHWITPPANPRRFDTWFYLARVPEDHTHAHDGGESVDSVWIKPSVALEDEAARRREIVFPTRLNVQKLGRSKTVDDALDAARQSTIVTVLPEVRDGMLTIPPEADYDICEETLERAFHK